MRSITYSVVSVSPLLLDLVPDELPLQLLHLDLDLFLGLQQLGTVFSPNDREVVFQAPVTQY